MTHLEFQKWCKVQHDDVCNQKYDKIHPYSFHLDNVRKEAVFWGIKGLIPSRGGREAADAVLSGAMGHDLIEDARVTYNDILELIGEEVANIIYACTEEKGRNRDERHNETYFKGLQENELALFVKLCDVISNVKYSLLTNSTMLKKYKKEYPKFKATLWYTPYSDIFSYIDKLLNL